MERVCLSCCLLLFATADAAAQVEQYSLPLMLLQSTCTASSIETIANEMEMSVDDSTDVVIRGQIMGWQASFTSGSSSFRVQRLAPRDRFRGARLEWWQNGKAELVLAVGSDCQVQIARRMLYDEKGKAHAVVHMDRALNDTSIRELLNPPVPSSQTVGGVRVAIIDSGVNYTLREINQRLARDTHGDILGYDFWDLDRRPFDTNPDRSPFFPRRHGTRTASLIIREAPDVTLLPYRYPRPDMSRMRDLLADLTEKSVKIVAMPLGSKQISEWEVFDNSARVLQDTLFIVSAGNSGVNIDKILLYPAGLELENMIVVTSADDSGRPAEGSNWGRRLVDLLVPAENTVVTDFDGSHTNVSGSSYAVSRIAAMAARLLAHHPDWGAPEIKQAILDRAVQARYKEFVRVGFLPDPLAQEADVSLVDSKRTQLGTGQDGFELNLSIVRLEDAGWHETEIPVLMDELNTIYDQCQIRLAEVRQYTLRVSPRLLDFDTATAHTLATQLSIPRPAVYLVRNTLRQPAYEGEAFGRVNTQYRMWLRDTVWLTADIAEPSVGLAHDVFHVLTNSGEHSLQPGNLMRARTKPGGIHLNQMQCRLAQETGLETGLLTR